MAGLLAIGAAMGQDKKAIDNIQKTYLTGKLDAAKEAVDKLIADPANASSPEAWLWKSTIDADYTMKEESLAKCPTCASSGYDAFKKYQALEPNLSSIAEIPFKWKALINLYTYFFNEGRKFYTEKKYNEAYDEYSKSAFFGKIITEKKIGNNPGAVDTFPILMCAYTAHFAKKSKEAVDNFSMLADLNYKSEAETEIYNLLLLNCIYIKDKVRFDKYYTLAQSRFPTGSFEDYKIEYLKQNASLEEKLQTYQAEDAKGTLSSNSYLEFGVFFSNFTKDDRSYLEKNEDKKELFHNTAIDALKKSYAKSNDTLAAFNIGVLYYNGQNDLDDKRNDNVKKMQEINATKSVEKDPKKKQAAEAKIKEQLEPLKKANADLEAKIQTSCDNSIEWLEKAYNAWKAKTDKNKLEKSSFKNAVKFLGTLYEHKREKVKGKDPKAYDTFDAKSKLFYDMYDKL